MTNGEIFMDFQKLSSTEMQLKVKCKIYGKRKIGQSEWRIHMNHELGNILEHLKSYMITFQMLKWLNNLLRMEDVQNLQDRTETKAT